MFGGEEVNLEKELLEICNKTFHGDVPGIWLWDGILPILKHRHLGITSNYRGITLSPAGAKMYNRMILKRIWPPRILNYPLMVAQILTLHLILEGVKYKNLPAVLTFVDFWKAFTRSTGASSLEYWKLMEYLKKLWKRQKYYTSTQLCKSSLQMVTLTSLRSMLVYCKGTPLHRACLLWHWTMQWEW